ncbi:MAG: nuclear transport factor 2 family protein [Rhodoferax sp.]
MPALLATLLLPALLTWGLGSAFRLSEEDMMIVFVVLFLLTFLISVAGAHVMEHGQRFRRQKLLEDMTPAQKLQWLLGQRQVVAALAGFVALAAWGAYRIHSASDHAPSPVAARPEPVSSAPVPETQAARAPTAPASTAEILAATVAAKAAREISAAQEVVQAWAAAWARKDVDTYLAAYSPLFLATEGLTRPQWEAQRRQRIGTAQGLQIKVMDLVVEPIGRDKVQAVFIQKYQTAKLNDLSRKTLILHKHGDDWKILSEQATPLKS